MKNILLFSLVFLFLFGVVNAAQLNAPYDLTISCAGYNCNSMNVTILYPNSSVLIDNQQTTNKIYYANYTINPTIKGKYTYYFSDGTNSSYGTFEVTTTGNELDNSQALLYLLVEVVLIFLFLLAVYGGIKIPFENIRVNEDEVIKVNWKKYFKIFCWAGAYMIYLGIIFIAWNLIYAYAQWSSLGIFLHYIFKLSYILGYIVLVAIIILSLVNYIQDKKIESFIKRTGLPFNV